MRRHLSNNAFDSFGSRAPSGTPFSLFSCSTAVGAPAPGQGEKGNGNSSVLNVRNMAVCLTWMPILRPSGKSRWSGCCAMSCAPNWKIATIVSSSRTNQSANRNSSMKKPRTHVRRERNLAKRSRSLPPSYIEFQSAFFATFIIAGQAKTAYGFSTRPRLGAYGEATEWPWARKISGEWLEPFPG